MKNDAPEALTLLVATHNKNKIREIATILDEYASKPQNAGLPRIIPVTLADVGFFSEIEENGQSFEENAQIKARVGAKLGYITIADDSGITVDALGGAPGIYSARYSGGDDGDNNEKLLRELAEKTDRTAHYVCAVSCEYPDGANGFTVCGVCDGTVQKEYRGTGGFGYDPLFYSSDLHKTFAEATAEEKHAVSHRGRAVRRFAEIFYGRLRGKKQ